ncbi:MAG: dienelactone hydrolase family protein [Hyphomonadaceae bacterium]
MSRFEARVAALAAHFDIVKPEGAGPFPVVLQFHGCGGVKSFQRLYAEAARDAGWAAIIVDSYAHRGITRLGAYATVCTGARLWGGERAGDLFAALAFARAQDWADASRLAVAGWSHGGWTVLDALAMSDELAQRTTKLDLPGQPLQGLIGAFLIYPYVGPGCIAALRGLRHKPPMHAIVCGQDWIVGPKSPARVLNRFAAAGAPVKIDTFATGTHAFDELDPKDLRVRADAALRLRAFGIYQDFLRSLSAEPRPQARASQPSQS